LQLQVVEVTKRATVSPSNIGYPSHIPFGKFGSLKFLDAAHVKDVLALLRFVENPRDRVAGFRILSR
jgi:superfamily I DNA/RNA helicase